MFMPTADLLAVGTLATKTLLCTTGSVMQHHIVAIPSHHAPCRRVVISTMNHTVWCQHLSVRQERTSDSPLNVLLAVGHC